MNVHVPKNPLFRISGLIFFGIGAIMIGLAFFLPRLIDINAYREEIVQILQESLNRRVSFSRGEFSMRIGPSFTFENLRVAEPDDRGTFLETRRVTIHLALFPLLQKRVVMRDVVLDGATVRLLRDSGGRLNIDDLLQPGQGTYQVHLKKIQLRSGTIHWNDMAAPGGGFAGRAEEVAFSMSGISRGHRGEFKLSCLLPGGSGPVTRLSLSGSAKVPASGPLTNTELKATCDLKQAEPGRYWPYYGRYIPFPNPGGRLDFTTTFKGTLANFSAKGRVNLAGAVVIWPTVFHHPVNPRLAQLEYELRLTPDRLDMSSLKFSADGFRVKGSCLLQDITSNDLRITARASTEPFQLEGLRQWIPYGIIADDASRYIEEHITGGLFRLETGLLDGRISQIAHMERGTNYNVLHIKGTVERGIVSYGRNVPAFANIRAGLEMLGKDFIVSRATGTFGGSPFKLDGRITDYPLETPCQYPFQMEIVPRPAEVAWIAKFAGAQKLEFSGNSLLNLKGEGYIPAYRLSGDWDLQQASYSFPGTVAKPAGFKSHLAFSSVLGREESRLTSLTYTLAPLALSATANLKYAKRPDLAFEIQTNAFTLGDSLPILTRWQSHRPRGRVQAHLTGSGNPEDFSAMEYRGAIALTSFSFLPGEGMRPISNINGRLNFKGNSLETSSISVNYGTSAVTAQGRISNFKHPEAEIRLSSPELFLRDITTTPVAAGAGIRNLQASVVLKDDSYEIRSLSGLINSSRFAASGTYVGGSAPKADLTISSPRLDVNDLLLLMAAGEQKGGKRAPLPELKLKLAVEEGVYRNIAFSNLKGSVLQENGVLYLQGIETELYGGVLTAKGRVAPLEAQGNRYDLNFNLARLQADRFLQALDITREVTGTLYLQGDITARGASFADIRKTALGNLRLRLDDGSLRRFSTLSKLFSILNVSQLFKFHLPDMVAGGMPYTEIKGSFSVKDGITSTQDLFIRGNAMNISIIGSADIVREEMNFTIGVQPLQTVDRFVNRIPVVGWILTGKDKSFITAYFEAKGKWSDPQVKAIPVKSMGKGVLNIFRRVFELPVRVFTDTGEVLLGQ